MNNGDYAFIAFQLDPLSVQKFFQRPELWFIGEFKATRDLNKDEEREFYDAFKSVLLLTVNTQQIDKYYTFVNEVKHKMSDPPFCSKTYVGSRKFQNLTFYNFNRTVSIWLFKAYKRIDAFYQPPTCRRQRGRAVRALQLQFGSPEFTSRPHRLLDLLLLLLLLLLQVIPVKVNYKYFTPYKVSSLNLKIIWSKRVSFFVFLRCCKFIRRSHGSMLSVVVGSDAICFYWNEWMKIDRSFLYTNHVQWHTKSTSTADS